MSDAEDLIKYTKALADHVQKGEQLLRAAYEVLTKCQNAETCDVQPPEELWTECQRLIFECDDAIDRCLHRSENLK